MFDYLQQFNNLSKDLRTRISSPEIMSAISALEIEYKVELAAFVMKVMIKKYSANKLAFPLMSDLKMNPDKAKLLEKELLEKVFFKVKNYLGIDDDTEESSVRETKQEELSKAPVKGSLKLEESKGKEKKNLFFQKQEKIAKIEEPKKNLLIDNAKDRLEEIESEKTKQTTQVNSQPGNEVKTSQKIIENKDIELTKKYNLSIDNQVKEAIEASSISLSSLYLSDRLFLTLKTYLKGIRDKISTRSVLLRSVSEGGLGLDNISVDKLFKSLDKLKLNTEKNIVMKKPPISSFLEKKQAEEYLKNINDNYDLKKSIASQPELDNKRNNQNNLNTNKDKTKEVSDALVEKNNIEAKKLEETENQLVEKPRSVEEKPDSPKLSTSEEKETEVTKDHKRSIFHSTKKEKAFKKSEESVKKISASDLALNKEIEEVINKEIEPQIDKNKFQPKLNSSQPRLDDIRMVNKIMGPIDELRHIDIVNFRRLAKTTEESVLSIKSKLNLLEKSSYEKMILGIEAWRKNPLNQLYRDITIESINQGKPIPEIIEQRKVEKKDVLSVEEFKALINFNREITF